MKLCCKFKIPLTREIRKYALMGGPGVLLITTLLTTLDWPFDAHFLVASVYDDTSDVHGMPSVFSCCLE